MENFKSVSERPKCAGRSLSPPSGTNRYPTPSVDSSPMHHVSNQMHFGNSTLWTLGEVVVAWYWLGRSLGSRPSEQSALEGGQVWKGWFRWMSGRWDVTLSFFFIVSFDCEMPDSTNERQKNKDVYNGLFKVYIKEEYWYIIGRVIYWTPGNT